MIKTYILDWYNNDGNIEDLLFEEKRHYKQQINTFEIYKSFLKKLM